MKSILIFPLILFLFSGCKKSSQNKCTNAIVTLTASICSNHAGVIINGTKYPTEDLTVDQQVEGKNICIEFTTFEDARLCACCGGKWVHIIKSN